MRRLNVRGLLFFVDLRGHKYFGVQSCLAFRTVLEIDTSTPTIEIPCGGSTPSLGGSHRKPL
jgi:hypothetical protein